MSRGGKERATVSEGGGGGGCRGDWEWAAVRGPPHSPREQNPLQIRPWVVWKLAVSAFFKLFSHAIYDLTYFQHKKISSLFLFFIFIYFPFISWIKNIFIFPRVKAWGQRNLIKEMKTHSWSSVKSSWRTVKLPLAWQCHHFILLFSFSLSLSLALLFFWHSWQWQNDRHLKYLSW